MFPLLVLACIDYALDAQERLPPPGTDPPDRLLPPDSALPEVCQPPELERRPVPVEDGCNLPTWPDLQVEVVWAWTDNPVLDDYDQVMAAPTAIPLTDDNGDGRIDRADLSDLVFPAYNQDDNYQSSVTALSGRDGDTLWASTDFPVAEGAFFGETWSAIAAGRLEPGGHVNLVTPFEGSSVAALDETGVHAWARRIREVPGELRRYSHTHHSPRFTDLDGDGLGEVAAGRSLLDHRGELLAWTDVFTYGELDDDGSSEAGSAHYEAVDLDGDGLGELIDVEVWYDHTGEPFWISEYRAGSGLAAFDADGDGYLEVVAASARGRWSQDTSPEDELGLHMRDHEANIIWRNHGEEPDQDFFGNRGFACVADYDGDGLPEWAAAGAYLDVVDGDGTLLWSVPVDDDSSEMAGCAAYDFNADGIDDIAYADEETFSLFDGLTGTVLFVDEDHSSGTYREHPIIVDLDGDGSAEIVVANEEGSTRSGIWVYRSAHRDWYTDQTEWPWTGARPDELDFELVVRPTADVSAETPDRKRAPRRLTGGRDPAVVDHAWCDTSCDLGLMVLYVDLANFGAITSPEVTIHVVGGTSGEVLASMPTREPLFGGTLVGPFALALESRRLSGEAHLRVERVHPEWWREDSQCTPFNDALVVSVVSCPE